MKCKHCQKEIEDSAELCPYCNTPVIRIIPKKICGYCYTELKRGDKACKGCGRKIPEELLKQWEEERFSETWEQEKSVDFGSTFEKNDKRKSQNQSEKKEVLLFSKKGGEEQQSSPDQEFLCLMLSICPPLASIIFRLLFSSTGFLPWPITILLVYCLSAMILSYFLEKKITRPWEEFKAKILGEGYRTLFYLCPPFTMHFLLKEKERNQLSFFLVLHFALLLLCFLPFY